MMSKHAVEKTLNRELYWMCNAHSNINHVRVDSSSRILEMIMEGKI